MNENTKNNIEGLKQPPKRKPTIYSSALSINVGAPICLSSCLCVLLTFQALLHGELLDYFPAIPQSHEITVLPDGDNRLELSAFSVEEKDDLKLV